MNPAPRVALLIETSNSYSRGLLKGILAYVRKHGPWSIYFSEQSRGDKPAGWFADWKGDGVIARIENEAIADAVGEAEVPVIDVSAKLVARRYPCVESDDGHIARLAARHLLERGFKYFGYCGNNRYLWSHWRSEPFAKEIAEAGFQCSKFQGDFQQSNHATPQWKEERELINWIRELPKPAGVMACNDFRAWQLLELCRRVGVSTPDEISVIGVDNDELLCELSSPTLTSIEPDTFRTGYEAARMLDRWMGGAKPIKHLRFKPLGIVSRQSTDVLKVADPDISLAVRYVRDHACEGINVEDVVRVVPLSRRMLEYRFKKLLNRTPHDEILRVQFQHVTNLLTTTDLPLAEIAKRTGFRYAEYFSAAFKQRFGMPPKQYRRKYAH